MRGSGCRCLASASAVAVLPCRFPSRCASWPASCTSTRMTCTRLASTLSATSARGWLRRRACRSLQRGACAWTRRGTASAKTSSCRLEVGSDAHQCCSCKRYGAGWGGCLPRCTPANLANLVVAPAPAAGGNAIVVDAKYATASVEHGKYLTLKWQFRGERTCSAPSGLPPPSHHQRCLPQLQPT